ncbi:MAG: DUF4349 domain-containing protein [Flammeovirgaceae bacterium]
MKSNFKTRLVKIIGLLIIGFIVLFAFRFIYGYTTGATELGEESISNLFSDETSLKRNYASDSYKFQKSDRSQTGNQSIQNEFSIDQKYEKTATVKSKTNDFEKDDALVKGEIKRFNAIIQYEQNTGKKGNRTTSLLLGVAPERFDSLYEAVIKIGNLTTKEITKVDKTSEFKNLNAKKASLEITRQSLLEIKKQNGRIEEFISLQNRILEIEQELQGLGVLLGDFSEENEFCTVRFSLVERHEIKISLLHRIKVAFEWSVKYYIIFIGIFCFASIVAFFLLLIIDKLLPSIMNKINQ